MKTCRFAFVLLFFLGVGLSTKAQSDPKMQSLFIFNFTRMIAWPQDYQSENFIIGVFGDSPIVSELQEIAKARMVGTRKIEVKVFNTVPAITKCHVLYVPTSHATQIKAVSEKLRTNEIAAMLVSDHRNALSNGAVVNFVIENNRQRYELSETNAKSLGLTLGGEMTRLALAVK